MLFVLPWQPEVQPKVQPRMGFATITWSVDQDFQKFCGCRRWRSRRWRWNDRWRGEPHLQEILQMRIRLRNRCVWAKFSLFLSSVFPFSFWNYSNNSAPPQPKKSRSTCLPLWISLVASPRPICRPPGLWKKNRPTPPPTLDSSSLFMCCLEVTVCFSSAIDGQSVSVVIARGLCDVCNNINVVTFVTDEQNAHSLCPAEDPANLVVVRIPRLSVRRKQSHMYLRNSAPSDVYLDMYVKDAVLCRATQWEPWSTSVK